MHMADSLLSPTVGLTMCAVSTAALVYSVAKVKKEDLCEKKASQIGVMSAFVFAMQMLNFAIPGTGSSGHIGGGILLAALFGSYPAMLAMSAILGIQSLFFADGGLLALGCNIFNLGVVPCLIIYPLVCKPIMQQGLTTGKVTIASVAAVVIGLQIGAFGVALETTLSGTPELPFGTFLISMLSIHLAIGLIEGVMTAAFLCFVYKMRSDNTVFAALAVITLIIGGGLSLFVSSNPDGLEWAIQGIAGTAELGIKNSFVETAALIQEKIAFMPNYNFAGSEGSGLGTTVAGILGSVITFVIAGFCVLSVSFFKRRGKAVAA